MIVDRVKTKKILIVDDEPNIVLALKYLLQDEGYQTREAYDGQSGFSIALEWKPDLAMLDIMMPEIDGLEVARRIRNQTDLNNVQILFLTAKGTSADRIEGYQAGAELYIVKPFDNNHILEKVAELLDVENSFT